MIYNHLHHQRNLRFALLFMMLFAGMTKSYAYDFSAVCETGQTLYYNITDAEYHYVELTYPGNSYHWIGWDDYDRPIGDISLPKYVYDAEDNQYLVTSIGSGVFSNCSGLTSITIPNSVTTIDSYAFEGCSGLTSITIPNSVTTIDSYAFDRCSGLTSITIPNSVTTIGSYAFLNCSGLTSITIPNSVTTIDNGVFLYCYGLEEILVESGNTVYDSRGNCNAIIHTMSNKLILGCKNTVIPNSVISIGNFAFQGCYGLTSITIPNSVTTIGSYAFFDCSGLTSITIPNSVTTIDTVAFLNCIGLTSITIPNSVTLIGELAFSGCSGLEEILVESGNTVYDSRDNCNAIIQTNTNELIIGCMNTIIPNSVTTIGSSAFSSCSGLTSITIPNSVTTIGSSAFDGCSGLASITIPNSVTTIGSFAFSRCSGLKSITIINSVTTIGHETFSSTNNCPIYVPYEFLNDYKTATYWNIYQNRIFPWLQKIIEGYGEDAGGWCFIASPCVANTAPTAVDNMITETEFDLYRFNQSAELEWENWKSHENNDDNYHFNLVNGQGYLYSNAEDVNLIFIGEFNEDDTKNVALVYDANAYFAGWNLVGNPFPVSAYANKSYYTMNEDGSAIDPVAVSMETAIPPCTGIMVRAEMTGQSVTFTRESRQVSNNNGILQIAVAQTSTRGTSTGSVTALDKAVVSFNKGDELGKFVFNKDNAKLYIPQGDEEYAIAYAEKQGEKPLNFEAKESGSYTISVNPESVEMDYLHLIDNMTGTDVDLLATPSYTFESKTSDYVSRFRLVFSANGNTDNENEETFAFFSNGNIIVTGDYANAMLQIVDMLGHVVVSTDVAHNVSTNGIASGVYVLRLINGNDVKTQKIVIR